MFAVAAEELIAFLWANSTTFGCEGSENCSRFLLDNYTLLYQVEQVRVKHALEFRAESKQGTRLPINGSPCFFRLRCTNTAFQPILICAPNCWIRPITGWIITHSQQVAEVVQHKMLVQAERPETARHFNQNLCNAMSASD